MKLALMVLLLALTGCYYYEDDYYYRPSVGVTIGTPGWGYGGGYRHRGYYPYRYYGGGYRYNRPYYRRW